MTCYGVKEGVATAIDFATLINYFMIFILNSVLNFVINKARYKNFEIGKFKNSYYLVG